VHLQYIIIVKEYFYFYTGLIFLKYPGKIDLFVLFLNDESDLFDEVIEMIKNKRNH
jgi:hypothetical protein